MSSSRYELKEITKTYEINGQPHLVLDEISLNIVSEDITVVLGASGCGKTTLLRIIANLEKETSGDISFIEDGIEKEAKVGLVFQESRLMPWLTVSENIAFHKKATEKQIQFYLSMMRLGKFENSYPNELSGGMAQRVSIARALSFEPDFLLMDEPFSSLDYFTRLEMQDEVINIHEDTNKGVIFVTHDIDEAINIGTRIIVFTGDSRLQEVTVNKNNNLSMDSEYKIALKKQILDILKIRENKR
ncbi:ATP-binding cassette domain-containing protein [Clostridium sp.]|uniref:ABC transporter ATP-binding protein n=1 Tax=Clostridium sp. TaxID=1506 RepID=UPI00260AFCCC|nr:ATP-binding cassette domain-containing protein [Clostridium sp.]